MSITDAITLLVPRSLTATEVTFPGVGVVVLRVKLPPAMLASHMGTGLSADTVNRQK